MMDPKQYDVIDTKYSLNTTQTNVNNKLTFVLNHNNVNNCRRLELYLANNITERLIEYKTDEKKINVNNTKKCPDFEFISWIVPGEINVITTSKLTRNRNTFSYGLNVCSFKFKFKGELCICEVITPPDSGVDKTPFINHDQSMNKSIKITFDNDKASYLIVDLLKTAGKYVEKNILDCEESDANIIIYYNDESYWEKCMNKRKRSLETIYLPKADKDLIVNDITNFLLPSTIKRYESVGRTHKRVYLFEGLPGTGKSSFILALASYFNYDVAVISFTEKVTDGTLARLLKNLPEKTILIMEDIDVLFNERKKNDDHKNMVTFSGILNNLDGITTQDGFICFITTNYKNLLDPALLRPGRIDKQLKFDNAIKEQIKDIFNKFMGELYTEDKFKKFYRGYCNLGISTTVSVIQEYLFSYIDNPDDAIININELKTIYEASVSKSADLYS